MTQNYLRVAADASAFVTCIDGSEHMLPEVCQKVKNYAQVEKEALALVFVVKKFHQYIDGRKFILITDHKPLLSILGPKTGIPSIQPECKDGHLSYQLTNMRSCSSHQSPLQC